MTEENAQTTAPNGRKYVPFLVAVLGAALGSTGTVAVYLGTPIGQEIARPDPFTGTQAAALTRDVRRLESYLDKHLNEHPDQINQFDRRIAILEAQYPLIMQSLARIESRLDRINNVKGE